MNDSVPRSLAVAGQPTYSTRRRKQGYGHRAEAGYLQIKGDKIYKDDGYGNKTLVGKVKKEKE